MSWFFARLVLIIVALAAGSLVGWWAGHEFATPLVAELLGAGTAVGLLTLFDSLRAHRLMEWLRGSQQQAAPRDRGFWGEIGYRVERALRQREHALARERLWLGQFLSAIEASPNGVLILDANDQIQWCNHVAADHFSLDPHRDLQQRITNLVRAPTFVGYLQAADYQEPLLLAGSSRGRGSLSVVVRSYGEGRKLILTVDVTERERADSMRRDFVANVSHEIRTPLTVLAGFIETMDSLPLTEVERRRVLSLMQQQTQRMQTLVADLLTLAQLEGSPRPTSDRWVSLDGLLQRIRSDALALSHGRHRVTVVADTLAELAGVEGELLSGIGNLVSNAVRYTPEGGGIDVHWRLLADGSGELCVADTGPGIAREHLPRLTERFYRVDGSRSRESGGTGLGLSIVKHVAQRHGGALLIESEVGKGSRFKLQFPAARVRAATAEPVSAEHLKA
ncbi:phosphate regulon sensor histidine kinase PhoR [Roseateles microcysteis]|uniref:phosphate regulon sensor histidine kinase PhoR n=1 Tax=Roseateles microcysteis TaxID=3119057 RepID=UPI002FE5AAA6